MDGTLLTRQVRRRLVISSFGYSWKNAEMAFVLIAAGLVIAVVGLFVVLNYVGRSQLTPAGAADVIERFLRGEATASEWDDFTSVPAVSAQVEEARKQCVELEEMHSAQEPPSYLDAVGRATLGDIARALRAQPNNPMEPTPKDGAAHRGEKS